MMKINYVLPLALLVSGAVNAATKAENPWYAGARIGGTHYSDFSNLPTDTDVDKDDFGGGAFLGYNFTPWFALETGYTYLGEPDVNAAGIEGSIEQQAIDLVGKFTWNTTDSMDIFAKAGGAYYFADGQDDLSAYDDEGVVATAGLGVEYFFTQNVSARLEYQYYHDITLDDLDDLDVDIDWDTHFYGLSLVYAWGAAPVAMPVMAEPEPVVEAQPVSEPEPMEIAPLTAELPFLFDSTELYLQQLAPIAQHLIDHPEAQVFIVGHTDSRGSEAYNQSLSEKRAALVGDYLATQYGIDKSRIVEEGRGELEPIASNDTEEGQAKNRRVSIFIPGLTENQ